MVSRCRSPIHPIRLTPKRPPSTPTTSSTPAWPWSQPSRITNTTTFTTCGVPSFGVGSLESAEACKRQPIDKHKPTHTLIVSVRKTEFRTCTMPSFWCTRLRLGPRRHTTGLLMLRRFGRCNDGRKTVTAQLVCLCTPPTQRNRYIVSEYLMLSPALMALQPMPCTLCQARFPLANTKHVIPNKAQFVTRRSLSQLPSQ
jgi:hypothetical protein